MLVIFICCWFMSATSARAQLYEGDECFDRRTNERGVCCAVDTCQSAHDDLRARITPSLCSFCEMTPVVCCRYGCANPNLPTQTHSDQQISTRKSQSMCAEYHKIPSAKPVTAPPPRPIFIRLNHTNTSPLLNNNQRTRRQENEGGVYTAAVGGVDAALDEFPHMVAIGWPLKTGSYAFNCGGTLISDRWVLTAGHCLNNARDTTVTSSEPTIVRLGDQNILDSVIDGAQPLDIPIEKRIKHPNFKPPSKYYDIALLGLQDSVKFSEHIKPACLWTKSDFETHLSAIVTGWGTTISGGRKGSEILQKVKLDIIDTETCNELLSSSRNRNWQGFTDHQMCAGVLAGGRDACQGDSGGPLQVKTAETGVKYHVIGITSFGRDCAKPNLPGVYTRVSAFIDWIESIVWP